MGIFDRVRKTNPTKTVDSEEKKVAAKTSTKAKVSETSEIKVATSGGNSARLLATPRVSEKAASLATAGTYVFNVPLSANKVEIRKAVESLYKVNVESVRTVRGIGKHVTRGRIRGVRANWKKALVTLKKGQKLDLYAGV